VPRLRPRLAGDELNHDKRKVDRRGFLRGAAATAASMAAQVAVAQTVNVDAKPLSGTGSLSKSPATNALAPTSWWMLLSRSHRILRRNPGSSFRGLHESIINYGGNRNQS